MRMTNESHARRKMHNTQKWIIVCLTVLLALPGTIYLMGTHADDTKYRVTLTTRDFGQNLFASAIDLSNPGHALFSLQNGTPLWYAISVQSAPAGMVPFAADSSDMVTHVFYGAVPLLPAVDVLPQNFAYGQQPGAILKLGVTFTGSGKQVELILSPYESHAALMDVISLLLHLLGEQGSGIQIGLLAPGALQTIFNDATSMHYLQSLADDYAALLQTVPTTFNSSDASTLFQPAYTCARDLIGLVADPTERSQLADILWLALGKTIARDLVVKTLGTLGQADFGLGMLGFLKDEAQVIGDALFQQSPSTLLLQSVPNAGAPTPTPTPISRSTPTPIPISRPAPTPTLRPRPTPTPTSRPRPTPTPRSRPTPTPTPKRKP